MLSYETVRQRTRVSIAAGEQFGYKWHVNHAHRKAARRLRARTVPNVAGITEFMKIVALAEAH